MSAIKRTHAHLSTAAQSGDAPFTGRLHAPRAIIRTLPGPETRLPLGVLDYPIPGAVHHLNRHLSFANRRVRPAATHWNNCGDDIGTLTAQQI